MLTLWDGQRWRAGPVVPFAGERDAGIDALDTSPDGALWLNVWYHSGGADLTGVIANYACSG